MLDQYIGQLIKGYRLSQRLGAGGFGVVYLGEHTRDQTQAAIKLLRLPSTGEEDVKEFFKQFINEASNTFRLKHPHIVPLLDFGIKVETPFLIMEYAPNKSLRERHPRGTQVPLTTIVVYIKQIASALQYAHENRLVHRDVKPENILVGKNNELLLTDFGIAVPAHSSSSWEVQKTIGSWDYAAPEHFDAKAVPASDQYSLAVVVYEWLCGSRPFTADPNSPPPVHFLQLARQHKEVPPPPLGGKVPTISSDVEQVIMKALAKHPQERFTKVEDFAAELQKASVASASAQATIYPSVPPAQMPTPPTTPAWPVRRDAGIAASGVPLAVPPVTQSRQTLLPPLPLSATEAAMPASPNPQRFATNPTPTKKEPEMPRISRREAIIWGLGVAGTFAAVVGYGAIGYIENHPSNLLYTYRGHSNGVLAVAWSPNGQRIASGGGDNTVQVWDATTGQHVYTYRGHSNGVLAVAWSPNGQRIASAGSDNTVQVWNAATGGHIFAYGNTSDTYAVDAVAWSPDGKRITSGSSDHTVQVRDATTGQHIYTYTGHFKSVDAVAWSPDGKYIASASPDSTVQVWNATTGEYVYTYNFTDPDYGICTMAWSPTSQHIALGTRTIDTVQVWDATTGRHVSAYTGHSNGVLAVAWSPNGQRIASAGSDNTVQVWIATTGDHVYTYPGSDPVAWSPNGKLIASGGSDNTVQVWSAG